uniref:Uncharacterized protein n=1 Tax=Globodera rostochiensis TaxID=31243 RepID=A0A914HG16_GLORO
MAQLSLQRKYGLIFLLGWLANLFLCCLTRTIGGALLLFLLLNSYTAVIFTIVFTVCQFLCVLITSLTLIADDDSNPEIGFKRDPILWIKSRHWVPILFSAIFLPLFAAQIFLINRYAGHLGLGSKRSGYSAPTTN